MKKTKMILTALSVFAIVGTALAFKAHKGVNVYCGTPGAIAGTALCPLRVDTDYFLDENSAVGCERIAGQICKKATPFSSAH